MLWLCRYEKEQKQEQGDCSDGLCSEVSRSLYGSPVIRGTVMEGSLSCVNCATLSLSPGSCIGFQWGQPRCLFWDPGPCKQLEEEGDPFKPGEGSAQLLFSVNQSQT